MRITLRLGKSGSSQNRTSALALVPLLATLMVGALVLPRPVAPRDFPLPNVDAAALEAVTQRDRSFAGLARRQPLDAKVRALGEAIRRFNAAEVTDEVGAATRLREQMPAALRLALEAGGPDALVELRALQLDEFLAEVARFERTGKATRELDELGGTFLPTLTRVGWCRNMDGSSATYPPTPGHPLTVVLGEAERRAAFKQTWNKVAGAERVPQMALTLDEQRTLYGFYLTHAHAPESQHAALEMARSQTTNAATCANINDGERVAALAWVAAKMKELKAIDPSYPFDYARGIVLFHKHEYAGAALAFRAWLDAHPSGAWTLRAQNYLLASERAEIEP